MMYERKSWNKKEDSILKLLYQETGCKKWSEVAEIMRIQYGILRNGKQCRQRYHNHLDQKISKTEWNKQEDEKLLSLHKKFGNHWALISRQMKGRTDNCVKNRFYSRFRRSIKNVNGFIKIFWKGKFKQLKLTFISKIIQIIQDYRKNKNKDQSKKQIFQTSQSIKNQLMSFSDCTQNQVQQNQLKYNSLSKLIEQISLLNKNVKKRNKRKKRTVSQVYGQTSEFYCNQNQTKQRMKYDLKKQKITQLQQNKFVRLNNLQKEYKQKQKIEQLVINPKDQNQSLQQGLIQKFQKNKIKDQTKLIIQRIQPVFKQDSRIIYQKYEQIYYLNIDQFFDNIQPQRTYYHGIDKLD